jgi:hypothetical protein
MCNLLLIEIKGGDHHLRNSKNNLCRVINFSKGITMT